jgi:hypothetical protein
VLQVLRSGPNRGGLAAGSSTTSVGSTGRPAGGAGRIQQPSLAPAGKRAAAGQLSKDSSLEFKSKSSGLKSTNASVQQQDLQRDPRQQQEEEQAVTQELHMQRELIAKLRSELESRDGKIQALEVAAAAASPTSRERLPPIDDDVDAAMTAAAEGGAEPVAITAAGADSGGTTGGGRRSSSSSQRMADAAAAAAAAAAGPSLSRPDSSRRSSQPSRPLSAAMSASNSSRPISAAGSTMKAQQATSGRGRGDMGDDNLDPAPWQTDGGGSGGFASAAAVGSSNDPAEP